tara:strand:- start:348 stop:1364 length:1017 start_codon:yes stop_codon:yes gene_type:complete
MSYIFNISVIIVVVVLILLSKHFKIFLDNNLDKHKNFAGKNKSYFIGGLIIFIFLFYDAVLKNDFIIFLFYFSFFLIGLLSDFKLLNSPTIRLLIQIITFITFVVLLDIKILETRLSPIDELLKNNIFNYFFVIFCLLVLVNGSNFVDGINTLLISYAIIIFLMLLINLSDLMTDINSIKNLIYVLSIIILFNLFGIIILGDSGSYLLSLYLGLNLIEFSNSNILISPYFVILLLWYPCFELLFSMIRRQFKNKDSYNPDTEHLHQLIYKIFTKTNNFKRNLNHFCTSFIILFYNLISFIVGFKFYNHTNTLISIIIINIGVYIISYNYLKLKLKLNK